MPIEGIAQPEILAISPTLRLPRYDGEDSYALAWYRDKDLVWMVDAVRTSYDIEQIQFMYTYQEAHGELYWIEKREDTGWTPIGDVCLSKKDIAIVIGPTAARGQGIGKQVLLCLVQRAKTLEWQALYVKDIYEWNAASQALFIGVGFVPSEKTEQGHSYVLQLKEQILFE